MANHKESGIGETISDHKVAVGLAAIVAAAAGAYYLYGSKKAPEHRRKLKGWMLRMKADALEQIEGLKEVNEEAYHKVIEGISEKYRQLKDVDPAEVVALASRMKTHWKDIQKDLKGAASGKSKMPKARTVKVRVVKAAKGKSSKRRN